MNGVTQSKIGKKQIEEAAGILRKYKEGKANLERRIIEEEKWWKLRHWDVINRETDKQRVKPVSAWLFNSIANKHADAMDNYPEPNVLPRERKDERDAEALSAIIPVIIERNRFEQTYSDAWWYKLKHGVTAYGVFWNNTLEDGLGDIDIKYLDLLNVFWEPGIKNIQDSSNLFIVSLTDTEILEEAYPQLKGKLGGGVIDIAQYVHDDAIDTSEKSVVVDWYYKKANDLGKEVLHFCKFAGSEVLFATEDKPEFSETGFYEHGRFPIVFDVMYPEEGTATGFGLISLMKDPQLYIDKLNQVILENAVMSTRARYFAKQGAGINEDEFLDWSKPIVHVEGSIDEERLRRIDVSPVPASALNILQMKIDELKETSANRDVSQGGTTSGATAAAAIAALQEAGNKTSRDLIHSAYRSFVEINYFIIELIRQFYDETRSFRITGNTGENEFIEYSNAGLKPRQLLPSYPGQQLEEGYSAASRKPVFDVVIKPQKRSAYSKLSQNELAKELYNLGFFDPQNATQSLAVVDMMDFDGKEKVIDKIQQGDTLQKQIMQMQQQMQQMAQALAVLTGRGETTSENKSVAEEASYQDGNRMKNQLQNNGDGEGKDLAPYTERAVKNARVAIE